MDQRAQTETGSAISLALRRVAVVGLVTVCAFGLSCVGPPGGSTDDAGGGADAGNGGCIDECQQVGTRICADDGQTVRRCKRTENGCLQFVEAVECPSYKKCARGTCVDKGSCSDRCAAGEPPRCNQQGQVVECDDHDSDGCFEWGDPSDCGKGKTCKEGSCEKVDCGQECKKGSTKCEGELIRRCERASTGCLEYSPGESCPEGKSCSMGSCRSQGSCRDECGASICTSAGDLRECKDVDGDGCKELAGATACSGGGDCTNGSCQSSCQDECPKGEKICVSNKISECADHDSDPCLEFDNPQSCPGNKTCVNDGGTVSCKTPQSSGKVVINEVLFDAMSYDLRGSGSSATSPTFIELGGPGGVDVSGYEIELVNGANGQTYSTVTIPSGSTLDGTGYAVLSMKNPNSYFTKTAPSMTNVYKILPGYQSGADALQNGPDNIILKDDTGKTIDALGYGSFSSGSSNFKGEGSAAPSVASGRSLGRDEMKDTDDNASDFESYYPTPGLENSDLLINEVYPNQPGYDDKTQTFIEIAAPIPGWEDLALDGYTVRALNGYNGKDYIPKSRNGIKLFGHKLHDGNTDDGYFVICNKKAKSPPQGPTCNVKYDGVDLQNGPDNVVLEYNGRVVDAIGYGSFGPNDHFEGEGKEVSYSYSDAGKSLSRWPLPNQFFDFDDNYLDFWKTQPSPGTTNNKP